MSRASIQKCLIFILIISACAPALPPSEPPIDTPAGTEVLQNSELLGRVVDDTGIPVSKANIKINTTVVLTDDNGWFHAPSDGFSQWVTVYKLGYLPRTRAASPDVPVLIRVSPDDGKTIVLKFTGDVMFGRRFFDMNSDGIPDDGLLPINPSVGDHLNLLKPIAPLLKDSDVTSVNLESVLNMQPYFSIKDPRPAAFHPTKEYIYATHPNAIAALMESGVNMIGLGNNHVYDMLDPGMANTIGFLDKLNVPHFGAGLTEAEAWAPAIVTVKGQKIAYIGCTTIFASGGVAEPNEITYVASDAQKKGGAAYCDKNKLSAAVQDAKKKSDLVIVMIHGGFEYDRVIPYGPLQLSKIAEQAGAAIVVNHHPHVVSGFSWDSGKIIGRSLGNFVFDQTIWPSFESYLFTVYVREGKVIRAFIEPVLIHDSIARGIAGDLAGYVARDAAGLEAGPFIMESDTMEVDVNNTSKQVSKSFDADGGTGSLIQIPDGQWVSGFSGSGKLLLGRDLLWIGGFENTMVDDTPDFLPLWVQSNTSSVQAGPEFAYSGQAGIRLSRSAANKVDAVTTNLHRIPVKPGSRIMICAMFRSSAGAASSIQVSWYEDTLGSSSSQLTKPLIINHIGEWQYVQLDTEVPKNVVALQVFLRLSPPKTGTSTTDFDNLRVIQLAPDDSEFSALYDFAYLVGKGNLTLSQAVLPGGEDWLTLPNTDISKFIEKQVP